MTALSQIYGDVAVAKLQLNIANVSKRRYIVRAGPLWLNSPYCTIKVRWLEWLAVGFVLQLMNAVSFGLFKVESVVIARVHHAQ